MTQAPKETTVEELIRAIAAPPVRGGKHAPSEPNLQRWSIRSQPLALPFYVAPTLTRTSAPPTKDTFCYLISAPAAVGKTTLANHLHSLLVGAGRTVLYVPLQHANIGDRYLAGLLSSAFPTVAMQQLHESLFGGSLVILFDGYDEVSMTTWQIEQNKLFVSEVVEAFQTYRPAGLATPCMVFLYRSVFSETGIFDALEPSAAHYRVEFFDPRQRRDYLRLYLYSKGEEGRQLVPLVDKFMEGFEQRAKTATPQAEAFFGHAIVLSAFGDYLINQGETNAFRLAQRLVAEGVDERDSVAILRGIIDNIVDREAGKFPVVPSFQQLAGFAPFDRQLQERIISELAMGPQDGTPLPAARALAGQFGGEKLAACPAFAALPEQARATVRQDYLQNLASKVELHPFVDVSRDKIVFKNPIYQEYYLARYIAEHPSVPLSRFIDSDRTPSSYLALFLLSLVPDRDLTQYGGAVFYTLRLLAAACRGDDYQIDIVYDAPSWLAGVEGENLKVAQFRVGRDSLLSLELPAHAVLQNFSIDGQCAGMVSISGPPGYDTKKSPILLSHGVITGAEVELDAAAITFDTVTVNADDFTLPDRVTELNGLETLTLQGRETESQDGGKMVRGEMSLRASEYARTRWGRELSPATSDTSTLEAFQGKVKKMLLWFRKHGRQEYGVYRPRFNTCATNKGRDAVAKRIAEFLFQQSILEDGQLIVLNQDILAKYDVFYVKQNELRFGPRFKTLFESWREYDRRAT